MKRSAIIISDQFIEIQFTLIHWMDPIFSCCWCFFPSHFSGFCSTACFHSEHILLNFRLHSIEIFIYIRNSRFRSVKFDFLARKKKEFVTNGQNVINQFFVIHYIDYYENDCWRWRLFRVDFFSPCVFSIFFPELQNKALILIWFVHIILARAAMFFR